MKFKDLQILNAKLKDRVNQLKKVISRLKNKPKTTEVAKPKSSEVAKAQSSQVAKPKSSDGATPKTDDGAKPKTLVELPVSDLKKKGGGVWNVKGKVDWKKSSITEFRGQSVLKVVYQKGSGTSAHKGVGGIAFNAVPRGLPSDVAMLSFDVFFETGWEWSSGGKFGGFLIGQGQASGYNHSSTASSNRVMFQRSGGVISYIYPPANLFQVDPRLKPEGHGVGYFGDVFPAGTLKVGTWNSVQIGVKNNTFDKGRPNADGLAFLQVNGKSVTKSKLRWSAHTGTKISEIMFSTFFGGPDPATTECVAYFKNFKLLEWDT
ncbi:hypothetical protein ACK3TF_006017 [Chlorella vulgaris]